MVPSPTGAFASQVIGAPVSEGTLAPEEAPDTGCWMEADRIILLPGRPPATGRELAATVTTIRMVITPHQRTRPWAREEVKSGPRDRLGCARQEWRDPSVTSDIGPSRVRPGAAHSFSIRFIPHRKNRSESSSTTDPSCRRDSGWRTFKMGASCPPARRCLLPAGMTQRGLLQNLAEPPCQFWNALLAPNAGSS